MMRTGVDVEDLLEGAALDVDLAVDAVDALDPARRVDLASSDASARGSSPLIFSRKLWRSAFLSSSIFSISW